MTFPTITEDLDTELKIMVSGDMYYALFRNYMAAYDIWQSYGFDGYVREYLRGFAFGPGTDGGDRIDHARDSSSAL